MDRYTNKKQQKEVFDYMMQIISQLLEYKAKGYLIFMNGDICRDIENKGWDDDVNGLYIDSSIYYHGKDDLDNGYFMTMEEAIELTGEFQILDPNDLKPLINKPK